MSNRNKPRTVAELIAVLQKFPPDMRVMIGVGGGAGCREGGYDDWSMAEAAKVHLDYYDENYYGPHTDADKDDAAAIDAVVLC